MAGPKLDGAGQAKMVTLDDAVKIHSRIHALVEMYGLSVKNTKPETVILNNVKRQMPSLASKLKGQFGMISDLVLATNMAMSRGQNKIIRVRSMREGMANVKVALEIAITQTINKHAVD